MATYTIAEVARRSGFPSTTLRYWEDVGLLPPAPRTPAGYRTYDDADLARLAFVARAKQLGCTLEEIGDLVTTWDGAECEPVQHRLRHLVDAKVGETHDRIAELTAFAAQLRDAAVQLTARTPAGPCDDRCGCAAPVGATTPVPLAARPGPVVEGPTVRSAADARSAGPPIACSLDGAALGDRREEWHAALAGVVAREPLPGGVRLLLGPGRDLGEIARLVGAEQSCCAFLRFALTVDERGAALEVRAPDAAADLLATLFGAA